MQPISKHWSDQAAARIVNQLGDQELYTLAAGITPSGTVHIGNFRESITVDFVTKSLIKLLGGDSSKVRFIFSWDDFDTFRKVPVNLPNQEMLKENLRRPISQVPDPFGKLSCYAENGSKKFEHELEQVGIKPEYIYQHKKYNNGDYAEQMKYTLDNLDKIKTILNKHRKTPLADNWLPTAIFCEKCSRDTITEQSYQAPWDYSYQCECGHKDTVDIRKTSNLKLSWRVDWPMRWEYEKVDFEPGGKDHSSQGGSYDTAKLLVKELWDKKPPIYQQYDFVMIKGGTGKMSSSKGELFTVTDALSVYSPQMVRWIFASQKPNKDFSLAFDEDVIKVYEEFDRFESKVLESLSSDNPKDVMNRRILELSTLDHKVPTTVTPKPSFRQLCDRLQICDGDIERTFEKYYSEFEKSAFTERANRAWFWIENYAPESFKYRINTEPQQLDASKDILDATAALKQLVKDSPLDSIAATDLNQLIYDDCIKKHECDAKDFFKHVYMKLISREKGPRLPNFMKELGSERVSHLL